MFSDASSNGSPAIPPPPLNFGSIGSNSVFDKNVQLAPGLGKIADEAMYLARLSINSANSGSITPRTQKEASRVKDFPKQDTSPESAHVKTPDNVVLAIPYEYTHQNSLSPLTRGEQRVIQEFMERCPKSGTSQNVDQVTIDSRNAVAQSVTRFAINPDSVSPGTSAVPYQIPQISLPEEKWAPGLHHVEKFILDQALVALKKQHTVIIDIFVSDQNGVVSFQEDDKPEIHSVVLWKKNINTIVLIDPSNADYSRRIHAAFPTYCQNTGMTLVLPYNAAVNNQKRIYGGGAPTINRGYSDIDDMVAPHPRDCIDIAVKIAFEIQVQLNIAQQADRIEQTVFGLISNFRSLNTYISHSSNKNTDNGTLLRILQSSVPGLRLMITYFQNTTNLKSFINSLSAPSSSAPPLPPLSQ